MIEHTTSSFGVSWFGILIVLIPLIGIIAAIAKARHPWRWILGAAAPMVAIGFVGFFHASRVQSSRNLSTQTGPAVMPMPAPDLSPRNVRRSTGNKPPLAEREPAADRSRDDQWLDAGQADFEANVYPSERSAAVALVRLMTKSWEGVLPAGQEPDKVLVNEKSNLEPDIVQAVLQTLQKKLGDGRVEMDYSHRGDQIEAMQETIRQMYGSEPPASAPAKTEPDATVRVAVSGDFHKVPTNRGKIIAEKRGNTVEVTLSGPAGKRTRSASFVNKPWVESGIDRAAQQPGQEQMVARSDRLCASRSEAERTAVEDAATKLIPLVRTTLEHLESEQNNKPSPGIIVMRQTRSEEELQQGIAAQMLRGLGVKDQFTQQLRPSYGDLWQHALLIDASDAQITRYAQTFLPKIIEDRKVAVRQRESWLRTGASLAGLILLVAVVYAFLNAATKGYYTWALRGSMVVLVLAGAAMLLLFMA